MKSAAFFVSWFVLLLSAISNGHAQDAAPASQPATTQTAAAQAATHPSTQPVEGVTLINLHLKETSPQDAFDAFAKLSGVKFNAVGGLWDQEGMQDDLAIDLTDKPFWPALTELCDTCNVRMQADGAYFIPGSSRNTRAIALFPGPRNGAEKDNIPTYFHDGFMVQALSLNHTQIVTYTVPKGSQNTCSLQAAVYVDPAIHLSSFNPSPVATKAVDDQNNSLLLDPGSNNSVFGGYRLSALMYTINIPLKYPEHPGKKLADLKFIVQMRGSTTSEKMEVDHPLDASEVNKDFGDSTVTFHSLTRGTRPGTYELKIGITSDNDQPSMDMYNQLQSAQLLDSKGRAFGVTGHGGGGGNGSEEYALGYSNSFNGTGVGTRLVAPGESASGTPAKWVLELPVKSHAIKLPVEFKDLRLP